jgi:hypothetical protein
MRTLACGLATALVLVGCHSIKEELPTEPTQTPTSSPVLTVAIPKITMDTPTPSPTPGASPKPSPTPSPTPEPSPTPTPTPTAGKCGNPLPPAVTRMNTKIHLRGPSRYTLDTTPLVGPDVAYCKKIGFPDRSICPVRPEGSADREACEAYAIGKAKDTGRPGPTWYRNGKLCTAKSTDCENHPDNQYLLWAYGGGNYEACTKDDVCGGVQVDR